MVSGFDEIALPEFLGNVCWIRNPMGGHAFKKRLFGR
jgi:hypothetical protein